MSVDEALVEKVRDGRVLIISMHREGKRNAVDRALADALDAAFNELEDDPDLWVGVLAGTTPVFSAGSDLTSQGDYDTDRGGSYGIIRRERRKPLIAAVEGPAFGGGMEIVLACDLVVASSTARFGLPEVRRGLVPNCAALFRGPQTMPLNLARELILTGEPIDPERAHQVGFVNLVTEPGQALPGAVGLAKRISTSAPMAVQACLAAVNSLARSSDDSGWMATQDATRAIVGSADLAEGMTAFFERRPPVWTGR
jgi:enoyl-CoA hydratase/carnithine racemase